jgi:hypothetical protein
VDWFNTQVAKASVPVRPIKNLSTNIRSGVALMRLVEVPCRTNEWEADICHMRLTVCVCE